MEKVLGNAYLHAVLEILFLFFVLGVQERELEIDGWTEWMDGGMRGKDMAPYCLCQCENFCR